MLQEKTNSKSHLLSTEVYLLFMTAILWSGLHIYSMSSSFEVPGEGVLAWNLSLVTEGKEIYKMALKVSMLIWGLVNKANGHAWY